jgi:hypothetical protein
MLAMRFTKLLAPCGSENKKQLEVTKKQQSKHKKQHQPTPLLYDQDDF